MSKNTSVTLGSHFEDFFNKQIQKGRYGSTSETVRAALRLLEEKEVKLDLLRKAIIEGEESGRAEYSLESFLEKWM
ncbi:ParD protein (antitoxin to ParE) [Indibacter alkaliphilus LW1]|jgi:antitoxin ParD1/3/4|uniref:ParD protein (Antitoxin to ParE) n=1 Tax=Indibacter alkaliphilus (strain CCUG 57479 / KCTC 22604 / LW1) TaxID=1189612 RepID=S2DVE3_INDAL|nr:type II toxin-antitoxin system ParD family antitoxin [Indibacter alkaliphilus]EOZ96031.1 ParD protein (antitoxin to ParE) [Indibacter alkaliphilus LW1]